MDENGKSEVIVANHPVGAGHWCRLAKSWRLMCQLPAIQETFWFPFVEGRTLQRAVGWVLAETWATPARPSVRPGSWHSLRMKSTEKTEEFIVRAEGVASDVDLSLDKGFANQMEAAWSSDASPEEGSPSFPRSQCRREKDSGSFGSLRCPSGSEIRSDLGESHDAEVHDLRVEALTSAVPWGCELQEGLVRCTPSMWDWMEASRHWEDCQSSSIGSGMRNCNLSCLSW